VGGRRALSEGRPERPQRRAGEDPQQGFHGLSGDRISIKQSGTDLGSLNTVVRLGGGSAGQVGGERVFGYVRLVGWVRGTGPALAGIAREVGLSR
jgi:hypothetical protein